MLAGNKIRNCRLLSELVNLELLRASDNRSKYFGVFVPVAKLRGDALLLIRALKKRRRTRWKRYTSGQTCR